MSEICAARVTRNQVVSALALQADLQMFVEAVRSAVADSHQSTVPAWNAEPRSPFFSAIRADADQLVRRLLTSNAKEELFFGLFGFRPTSPMDVVALPGLLVIEASSSDLYAAQKVLGLPSGPRSMFVKRCELHPELSGKIALINAGSPTFSRSSAELQASRAHEATHMILDRLMPIAVPTSESNQESFTCRASDLLRSYIGQYWEEAVCHRISAPEFLAAPKPEEIRAIVDGIPLRGADTDVATGLRETAKSFGNQLCDRTVKAVHEIPPAPAVSVPEWAPWLLNALSTGTEFLKPELQGVI